MPAFDALIAALKDMGEHVDTMWAEIKQVEADLQENMLWVPNPGFGQIMPSLSYAGKKLTLLYYAFQQDFYPNLYNTMLLNADCNILSTGPAPAFACQRLLAPLDANPDHERAIGTLASFLALADRIR